MSTAIQHHPVFAEFPPRVNFRPAGMNIDFLGTKYRLEYVAWPPCPAEPFQAPHPILEEEYFEWISLLAAARAAERRFVMIELGAGFGRWLVRGAFAARQRKGVPSYLVGVEAEPTHFRWLRQNLRENGLSPRRHWLIEAAASGQDGTVWFATGEPAKWWGQNIEPGSAPPPPVEKAGWLARLFGRRPDTDSREVKPVRAVSLTTILRKLGTVDLIDSDVQGAEADVFEAAAELVDRQVKRVTIGTHSAEVEARLRVVFNGLGWRPAMDYPCAGVFPTPWGDVDFQDGVQVWLNPKLGADEDLGIPLVGPRPRLAA